MRKGIKRKGSCQQYTGKKRKSSGNDKFISLVDSAGIKLYEDAVPEISVEAQKFKHNILKSLSGMTSLPSDELLDEFVSGYKQYIAMGERLLYTLLPVTSSAEGNFDTRSVCFSRLLLSIDCLQTKIAILLIEKLLEFNDTPAVGGQHYHVPKLILNQLRWLDIVVDGQVLCDKLLEVLDVLPVNLQRDIIQSLPQIISDDYHSEVAEKLQGILEVQSDLIAACVDALSNLNISTEVSDKVLEVTLERMSSCDCGDLPVLIEYVSHRVTPKNCVEIIRTMRENLDVESCFTSPIASSTPFHSSVPDRGSNDGYVVLNSICSSLNYMKCVSDGWLKVIESIKEKQLHNALDLFILCILHNIPSRRKAVVSVVTTKVKSELFTNELIQNLFRCQLSSIGIVFPSMLALCQKLSCSLNEHVLSFAKNLYILLFTSFDTSKQQEVIASLITNIGSGISHDIDCALSVLESLLETCLHQLVKFSVLTKTIMDFLDHFNMSQTRRLYSLLSALMYYDDEDVSALSDDLHSLIRKQLFHHEAKFKQFGVIGAVIIISQITSKRNRHDTTLNTIRNSDRGLSAHRLSQAKALLEQVTSKCTGLSSLFYEEMCSVVLTEGMHEDFLKYLLEEITGHFQDLYVIEANDPNQSEGQIETKLQYSLEPATDEDSIAINLFSLLTSKQPSDDAAVESLPSHFKLLRTCEQVLNGGLSEIDALLGCPVVFCGAEMLQIEHFENLPMCDRQLICSALFHCMNWFRETVSSFAHESENEMKWKVLFRLKNLTAMQKQLKSLLSVTSGPLPFITNCTAVATSKSSSKSQKLEQSLITTQFDQTIKDVDTHDQLKKGGASPFYEHVISFLRPLELSAYCVLSYGPLSRSLMDTDMQPNEAESVSVEPPDLLFLLENLKSAVPKGNSVFGAKSSQGERRQEEEIFMKLFIDNILSGLCDHLENLKKITGDQQDVVHSCLLLIYEIIASFFKLSVPDDLLSAALKVFLRRSPEDSQGMEGKTSLSQLTVEYFKSFSSAMPTLSCAAASCKLLVSIAVCTRVHELKSIISECCKKFLEVDWEELETVHHKCDNLEHIIRYYLEYAEDPISVVETFCCDIIPELMGDEPLEKSTHFASLNLSTFACFFRCMLDVLNKSTKKMLSSDLTTTQDQLSSLMILEHSSRVMYMLINLVKSFDTKPVLSAALKYGKDYVEICAKNGLPVIDASFKARKDEVLSVIKVQQKTTRCLQHYCGHSKVERNTALTGLVPKVKRSLEMFVFEVKEVLINHECLEAFFVANLKNRNLKGEEILTQVTVNEESQMAESTQEE